MCVVRRLPGSTIGRKTFLSGDTASLLRRTHTLSSSFCGLTLQLEANLVSQPTQLLRDEQRLDWSLWGLRTEEEPEFPVLQAAVLASRRKTRYCAFFQSPRTAEVFRAGLQLRATMLAAKWTDVKTSPFPLADKLLQQSLVLCLAHLRR